jgi:hypothetical protein
MLKDDRPIGYGFWNVTPKRRLENNHFLAWGSQMRLPFLFIVRP